MKFLYSVLFLCFFTMSNAFAQVSVTATAATPGPTSYTTLKAAFDAVNAGTHKGVITISINGNTTETASAVLDSSGVAASYTSVAINASGAFTISSNLATPTIQLNGADNVNLNGNSTLQIINTNSAGAVISFIRDATNNTVRNTIIKGATASHTGTTTAPVINSGVVHFGTGLLTGNDNNTIDNCEIDGGSSAICLVFSLGSSATSSNAIFNSDNTLKNTRLHDYINSTIGGAVAVSIANSTEWTIENNSIYFTSAVSTPMQFLFRGILIVPAFTNDFHTVTGNFLGGNSPNATGTMSVSASSTNALGFIGMDIETGGTGNTVSNNTIKNINITYGTSAGSFSNSGIFAFIGGYNGTTTLTGNTVSNINYSNTTGFIQFNAIHANGRVTAVGQIVKPVFNVTNNTISSITMASGGTAGDVAMMAIRLETSSSGSLSSGNEKSNPYFNVTGNTVSNLSSAFQGVSGSYLRGISTVVTQGTSSAAQLHPKINISNNTIHTFTNASGVGSYNSSTSTYANYTVPVVVGVHFGGSSGSAANVTDTARINGNVIYNLNATNTGNVGAVATGILASTGILEVTKNKVYGLKNAASGAFSPRPALVGINIRRTDGTANSLVANNFISLGTGSTGNVQIFGMLNNFAGGTGPLHVFHNSVVITGVENTGSSHRSAAFHRGTEEFGTGVTTPVTLKNNILYNTRTGTGSHYALSNTSNPPTGLTSDYNNLYAVNHPNFIYWGTTDMTFADFKTASGDVTSKSVTVNFVDVASGDLHLAGASITDVNLNATPAPNVTTDYDNDTRSATDPTMGADEGSVTACVAPAITTQPAAQQACLSGNASFSVTATGTSLTYQWRKAGVNISGATSSTFTITGVTATDIASYDVVITNGCGTATSASAGLTMKAATAITTQPAAQTLCAGGNASFSVTGTGEGTLTYQWRKNGTNISGATSATYSINGVTAADAGSYDVNVTGECGTVLSSSVALTVNAVTAITTQPAAQTVCAGTPANFTVVTSGTNLTYQWRKGGTNIAGATAATFNIATVAAGDAGNYDVVVTGTCGTVTSNAVALALQTTGCTTSLPVIGAEVESAVLMPNVISARATLRLVMKRSMQVSWIVTDAHGREVRSFASQATAGSNDLSLQVQDLPAGLYYLNGRNNKGHVASLKFIKQ